MTRQFGLSRRAVLDGGTNTQPGARMRDEIQTRKPNSLPAPSLPADWELPPSGASLFILDDDTCAICVLAVVVSSFAIAIGLLIFAGAAIFGLVDLG
jgi:hypothetical protein